MAGPYTEKAIGDAPEATTQEPEVNVDAAYQDVEDTDSIEKPYKSQVSRSLSLQDPGYGWRPNFNPEQDPRVIGHTTQVGKYGGAPIFDRTSPIFVADAIASRQQANAEERRRLDATAAKLADPFADIEDIDRAEYRKSAFDWATSQLLEEQQQAVDLVGDTQEAMQQLGDPRTPLGKQHKARVEAINTVFRHINTVQKEAGETIDGMESGGMTWDQQMYDDAQELRHAYSTGGSGNALEIAKKTTRFHNLVDVHKYLKQSGLAEALQRSAIENDTLGAPRFSAGKIVFDKNTEVRTPEDRINILAESMPPGFRMRLGDDELKRILRSYTPQKNLQDPTYRDPNTGGQEKTRGKQNGWVGGGWQQDGIRLDLQGQGTVGRRSSTDQSGKTTKTEYQGYALKIRRDQDGEWVDLKPIELRNSNNVNTLMLPTELVRRNGRWFVSGKQYAYSKQRAAGGDSKTDLDEPSDSGKQGGFEKLGTTMVPVDNNKDWLTAYGIPADLDGFVQGFPASGIQKNAQPVAITPAQFDAQWAKLPKGGTLVGPDGKTYRKP